MKLEKPFKKKVRNDDDESPLHKSVSKEREERSSSGGSPAVADWAVTGGNWKRLSKESKVEGRRAPELWVPDGESRTVRFIDDEPIASFKVYKMKHNGKWRTFVAPAPGQTDLFATAMGLKATRIFLFRVIDIDGYKNKEGKEFKNQPRFLCASTRIFDNIQMMAEDNADAGNLSDYNVRIRRSGTGTNTTYNYMPRPASQMTPEMKKAAASFPKFTDYYRPPSKAQQEAIAISHGKSVAEDEDDD
jgi:hypothetical protein